VNDFVLHLIPNGEHAHFYGQKPVAALVFYHFLARFLDHDQAANELVIVDVNIIDKTIYGFPRFNRPRFYKSAKAGGRQLVDAAAHGESGRIGAHYTADF
jgi:hypothetical protein